MWEIINNLTNLFVVNSFPIQGINQITINQQLLSLYCNIMISFSMIAQQANPTYSLSICLFFQLIYTNGVCVCVFIFFHRKGFSRLLLPSSV